MGTNSTIGTDLVEIVYDTKVDELTITSKNLGRAFASSKQRIMGANIVVFISNDEPSNSSVNNPNNANDAENGAGNGQDGMDHESDKDKKRWNGVPVSLSFMPLPGTAIPKPSELRHLQAHDSGVFPRRQMDGSVSIVESSWSMSNNNSGSKIETPSLGETMEMESIGFQMGDSLSSQEQQFARPMLPNSGRGSTLAKNALPMSSPSTSRGPQDSPAACGMPEFQSQGGMIAQAPSPFGHMRENCRLADVDGEPGELAQAKGWGQPVFPPNPRDFRFPISGTDGMGFTLAGACSEMMMDGGIPRQRFLPNMSSTPATSHSKGQGHGPSSEKKAKISHSTSLTEAFQFQLTEDHLSRSSIALSVSPNMRMLFKRAVFSKRKSVRCLICGIEIHQYDALLQHMSKHKEPDKTAKIFSCPVCRKQFAQSKGLYKHTSVHVTKDLYACPACNNHYTRLEKFKSHFGQAHPAQVTLMEDFVTLYTAVFRNIVRHENLYYSFQMAHAQQSQSQSQPPSQPQPQSQ